MAGYFQEMGQQIERNGESENLPEHLAREELTENGNWCSYKKDNTLDFDI